MRSCCAAAKALLLVGVFLAALGLSGHAAEKSRHYRFNVPAGDAETALKRFATQSGRQILFPTEAVTGVQTNSLKGRYTMAEALDLLLSGTALFAREDEPTGAISIGRLSVPSRVIELPLFVVKESPHAPWRYGHTPGVEVLSRCPDETTRRLLEQNHRLLQLLELIVPARLQVSLGRPASFVLYAAEGQPTIAREIIAELEKQRRLQGRGQEGTDNPEWNVRVLPNYRFWDQDSLAIFFILSGSDFNKGRLALTPDYLRYRLEARTPSLPAWFVEGVVELYRSVTLEPASAGLAVADDVEESAAVFWPMNWVSDAATEALRKSQRPAQALPALAGLFEAAAPDDAASVEAQRWRAQAALLIRWALDESSQGRREGLWEFVDRTSRRPATEAMFRECLGLDYAEAGRQLGAYLPKATKDSFKLELAKTAVTPEVALRDATGTEIARIKGDLERLEIPYVAALYPQLAGYYAAQARRTLRVAYDKGDRDPRLLASLGLTECAVSDDAAALPFLREAAAQGVDRPRAYYELARITFANLQAKDSTGRLTLAEAGTVLQPLAAAQRLSPPMSEVYELIAEVWLRSEGRLSARQLKVLDAGVGFFPRHVRLIYADALLHATHGFNESALALIERGWSVASDPGDREDFEKLKTAINSPEK